MDGRHLSTGASSRVRPLRLLLRAPPRRRRAARGGPCARKRPFDGQAKIAWGVHFFAVRSFAHAGIAPQSSMTERKPAPTVRVYARGILPRRHSVAAQCATRYGCVLCARPSLVRNRPERATDGHTETFSDIGALSLLTVSVCRTRHSAARRTDACLPMRSPGADLRRPWVHKIEIVVPRGVRPNDARHPQ